MVRSIIRGACLLTFAFLCAGTAHAAGTCKDPWINNAFTASMLRPPQGTGVNGECNPNLYSQSSWSSQQDLNSQVVASKFCPDPWIGEIYRKLYNRQPNATECRASNYGGGQWSSFADLTAKVQAYVHGASAPATASVLKAPTPSDLLVNASLDLVNSNGAIVALHGTYIVASGAGNIVASGAGNVKPGDVIQGGAASLTGYSVQSVGGKRTIQGTIVHH